MRKITNEQLDFLREMSKKYTSKEIIPMFYEKFGINLSIYQIKAYKQRYGIRSFSDGKFKKGRQNTYQGRPMYSEFIDGEGYVRIKTPEGWKRKGKYIYEKYVRSLENDEVVIFLNQDKRDFSLDNLMAVKKSIHAIMRHHNLFSTDREITKTGVLLAEVMSKKEKLRKKVKEKENE